MKNKNGQLSRGEFKSRMSAAIMQYSMLHHPFYKAWSEGRLSRPILAEYAKQYYAHVRAFPTYVSAVHSRCGDLSIRQMLLENLIEEERGGENHPELWLRFAEALGVTRDAVRNAELLSSTTDSVEKVKSLTHSEDYREGLAAIYAYESQIPAVARTKREGLQSYYGIEDPRAVSFFRVHESVDLVHQQVEMKILNDQCGTRAEQDRVVGAAKQSANALLSFLDGVATAYLNVSSNN